MRINLQFLKEIYQKSTNHSIQLHGRHWELLERMAEKFKEWLNEENLIKKINYDFKTTCLIEKNQILTGIDGGLLRPKIPHSVPYAVRSVFCRLCPGKKIEEIVPVFFSCQNLYDRSKDQIFDFEYVEEDELKNVLNEKLQDAALKMSEIAVLNKLIFENMEFDRALLHGPIQSPMLAFSDTEFPSFTKESYKKFLPFVNNSKPAEYDRHFIKCVLDSLVFLKKSGKKIFGIVENPRSGLYFNYFLNRLQNLGKIGRSEFLKLLGIRKKYNLHDQLLFDLILNENEYSLPIPVHKQQSSYGGNISGRTDHDWMEVISQYPDVFISYLKPGNSTPLRIESLEKYQNYEKDFLSILHQCLSNPHNPFPFILSVADEFAKCPEFLKDFMENIYKTKYLENAFRSKNKKMILSSLKMIGFNNRRWTNRPQYQK